MPAIDTVARRYVAVLAAGALLPLAGCSSTTEDSAGGATGAARDVPTASRAQVAEGGTLRWAVDSVPQTFNTYQPDADATTDRVAGATLPSLFTLDEKARPQANKDYLVSAKVTASKPRQTVVYKLNPKAKWNDGRSLGAKDFVAQWKALNGRHGAYWSARNAGYNRIAKIGKGPGAHQVKVVFGKPYADWQSLFAPLYPKSAMRGPHAFNQGSRKKLPVSAGPFKLSRVSKASRSVSLVRDPAWWGERAKLDRIRLKAVPRAKRAAALEGHKLDLAEVDGGVAQLVSAANASSKNGDQADKQLPQRGAPSAPGEAGHAARGGEGGEGGENITPREPGQEPRFVSGQRAADSLHAWADAHLSEKARKEAREEARKAERAEREKAAKQRAKAKALAAQQRQLRGYTLRKALDPAYTQLALNGAEGPLADERVRRAVARAIDREALAEQALSDSGLPAKPLGSHLRMVDQHGYSDNSAAIGKRDVESAQSLLGEAGWKGGPAQPPAGADGNGDGDGKQAGTGHGDAGAGEAGDQYAGTDDKPRAAAAQDDGKPAARHDAPDGSTGAHPKSGTGPERVAPRPAQPRPQHRTEAEAAAVSVSAEDAARVEGKPLSPAALAAGQRAALLVQAARAELRHAVWEGSPRKKRVARAALRAARDQRATADELRLLSGGRAMAVRTKDGKPLALRFVLPAGPGSGPIRATGERIADMLNGIGVRTQIKKVADESYFKDHIAAGEYDLALYSWPASAYPATDARPIFAKPRPAADGSLSVGHNYTRVGTDQIDQLFEQASGELDEGERDELIRRADARIWAAAGSVPLYQRPQLVATKDKVVNAGAFGFQTPRYQDIGYEK
ncbi:ABC transporter family substrate-binding protein [Streptomyces daliensis]